MELEDQMVELKVEGKRSVEVITDTEEVLVIAICFDSDAVHTYTTRNPSVVGYANRVVGIQMLRDTLDSDRETQVQDEAELALIRALSKEFPGMDVYFQNA